MTPNAADPAKIKSRKLASMALAALSVLLCFVAAEVILSVFSPAQLITIGRATPENASHYGWGYDPQERIIVSDPDSSALYVDFANNHGWRDRDRNYENAKDAFRILVLGDSITFGAIVPGEAVYTRVLEARLRAEGYAAEVINISYGGWSTDQQLEALRREGLRYRPDLVIVQFSQNDLGENALIPGAGILAIRGKPFFYTLAENGRLIRHENKNVKWQAQPAWKELAKKLVVKSEILKRAYLVQLGDSRPQFKKNANEYRVTGRTWRLMQLAFGVSKDDELGSFLAQNLDNPLDQKDLIKAIDQSPHMDRKEEILRAARHQWFMEYWDEPQFRPKQPDPNDPQWRLFFELLKAMKEETAKSGGELLLFSDQEQGIYEWERYWNRISAEDKARANFLEPTRILKEFAGREGIGFIDSEIPHRRARLDPHPNIEGNRAMAENIYRYLMSHYRDALDKFRRKGFSKSQAKGAS